MQSKAVSMINLKEEIDIIVEKMFNQVKKVFNIDFHNDMYLRKALGIISIQWKIV